MKLCVNCKHHRMGLYGQHKCIKHIKTTINPVDGKSQYTSDYSWKGLAELQREDSWIASLLFNSCGKWGRFYEPKELKEKDITQESQRLDK